MAHIRKELGLCQARRLGSCTGIVRQELLLLQLLDQPVVLGAVLEHRKRSPLEALHQEHEIEVDAGGDDGHEPVEWLARHEEAQAKRGRHRDRARMQDRS